MTLLKQIQDYENQIRNSTGKDVPEGILVTVSGISGSGKTYAAEYISKKLGLGYFSSGSIFRKLAKERGKSLEDFCSERGTDIDNMVDMETLKMAFSGNMVLDGRLSGWVASDIATAKIFILCPLETRASRVALRDNIAYENAVAMLQKRDVVDREKYLRIYGIDVFDQSIYDEVVDNSGTIEKLKQSLDSIIGKLK